MVVTNPSQHFNGPTLVGRAVRTPTALEKPSSHSLISIGMSLNRPSFQVAFLSALATVLDVAVLATGVAPSVPMMRSATNTLLGPFCAKIYLAKSLSDRCKANIAKLGWRSKEHSNAWAYTLFFI